MSGKVKIGQVARSTPFDDTTGKGFDTPPASSLNVQTALEDLRNHTIYISRTQATTASGTLTLNVTDMTLQFLTGTATGYSVVLPDATTLLPGWHYKIDNTTTQPVAIKDGSGAILFTLGESSIAEFTLQSNSSVAGAWVFWQTLINTGAGVITYNSVSATTFSTTSTSDVIITGFTVTPQAGTYQCLYNAASFLTTTPKSHWWSFYKNGTQVLGSERYQDTSHSNEGMVDSLVSLVTFNGTETFDVRVRTENGTLSIFDRTMILIRLGA